jgi:hypothetical protein
MKPLPSGFAVIMLDGKYQVVTKYDLLHMNTPHPTGILFDKAQDAFEHAGSCYVVALKEYERCVEKGQGWPCNE